MNMAPEEVVLNLLSKLDLFMAISEQALQIA